MAILAYFMVIIMNNKLTKGILVFVLYLLIPMIIGMFLPSLNNSNLLSVLVRFIIDVGVIALFIYLFKDDFKEYNKGLVKNPKKVIGVGLLFALFAFIAMPICNIILHVLNVSASDTNNDTINTLYGVIPLYMMFQTLIYSPIVEGITFRKVFKDAINNKWLFIIISGFVFGLYHIIYNMTSLSQILLMLPYFVVGMLYAGAYSKTDNIYSAFIATFVYNLAVFVINLL